MIYDTIIIGTGPAGLTASLYASCFHLTHIVIGKVFGGQMMLAPEIINYPGFTEISGQNLSRQMINQVKLRGGQLFEDIVVVVEKEGTGFLVKTKLRKTYQALSIILATGTDRKRLNVPGELEYINRGVHYCVVCERQDYQGKVVAVVGGGNAAIQGVVQLAHLAAKVILFVRSSEIRADAVWVSEMKQHNNIEVCYNTKVLGIVGDGNKLTSVKVLTDSQEKNISLDKFFVEIGGVPGTALVSPLGVAMDPGGYIHVDGKLSTNIPGVFAAGDLVSYGLSIEQISSAVGLGARAAASAFSYLKEGKAPSAWGSTLIKR